MFIGFLPFAFRLSRILFIPYIELIWRFNRMYFFCIVWLLHCVVNRKYSFSHLLYFKQDCARVFCSCMCVCLCLFSIHGGLPFHNFSDRFILLGGFAPIFFDQMKVWLSSLFNRCEIAQQFSYNRDYWWMKYVWNWMWISARARASLI